MWMLFEHHRRSKLLAIATRMADPENITPPKQQPRPDPRIQKHPATDCSRQHGVDDHQAAAAGSACPRPSFRRRRGGKALDARGASSRHRDAERNRGRAWRCGDRGEDGVGEHGGQPSPAVTRRNGRWNHVERVPCPDAGHGSPEGPSARTAAPPRTDTGAGCRWRLRRPCGSPRPGLRYDWRRPAKLTTSIATPIGMPR